MSTEQTTENDETPCGRPRRYFCQQTCELPGGHDGPHEDATHIWEDR